MQGEEIKPREVAVVGGVDGQELSVPGAGACNRRELLTNREAVVETIKVEDVVASGRSKSPVQRHQAVGLTIEGTVRKVTRTQTGVQQILAGEAGVQVQAQIVVEGRGTERGGVALRAIHTVVVLAAIHGSAEGPVGVTLELGGGGELGCFQLANLLLEAVDTALDHSELLGEVLLQALDFVGDLGDAIQAGVQQGSRFIAGHGLLAFVGAVGIAGHTAVLFHQVAECLVGPIGGLDVGQLGDGSHLVLIRPDAEVVQVALLDVAVHASGCKIRSLSANRSHQAQGSRRQKKLLEQFHGPHTKSRKPLSRGRLNVTTNSATQIRRKHAAM